MPSHITHYLFVKEAVERSFGDEGAEFLRKFEGIIAFSAQGPDLFYHNQRTRPGAFKYGRILHRGGYGRFLTALAMRLIPNIPVNSEGEGRLNSREGALLLGLASHAILDRFTHPYIISRAGWVRPGDRKSQNFFRIHPFFERIIDRVMYEQMTGHELFQFDFYRVVSSIGKDMEWFQKELIQSIFDAYPNLNKPDLSRRRLRNALRDALFFYEITDPTARNNVSTAYERDMRSGRKKRYLALYHPRTLDPDVDYLNMEHSQWPDPFEKNYLRYESFPDLFEEAVGHGISVFREIRNVIQKRSVPDNFDSIIGNGNLSNGGMDKSPEPHYADPLDLNSTLERQYEYYSSKSS